MNPIWSGLSIVSVVVLIGTGLPALAKARQIEGVNGVEIQLLENEIAADSTRNDLRLKLSSILESIGEFKSAIKVLQQGLEFDQFVQKEQQRQQHIRIHLYLGWLYWRDQKWERALEHYKRVVDMNPKSEEGWLGIQLVWIYKKRWQRSIAAGKRALTVNDRSYFGQSRVAYARFQRRQNRRALKAYTELLEQYPYDPESHLGVALALIALDRIPESKIHCAWAKTTLLQDPRFRPCLGYQLQPKFSGGIGIHGSYVHFLEPWNAKSGGVGSASGAIAWGRGWGVWAGGSYSSIVLQYQKKDFWQAAPVLGANLHRARTTMGLSLAWIFSADKITRNSPVVNLSTRYDGNWLGGSIEAAGSFYPEFPVVQVESKMHIAPGKRVSGSVGPAVVMVGPKSPRGPAQPSGMLTQLSGHGEINWWAHERILLSAKGFGGFRSYAVESAGLGIWTIGDRFTGSYRLGMSVRVGQKSFLDVQYQQQFGDQQGGRFHRFSILSGTVGARMAF